MKKYRFIAFGAYRVFSFLSHDYDTYEEAKADVLEKFKEKYNGSKDGGHCKYIHAFIYVRDNETGKEEDLPYSTGFIANDLIKGGE